MILAETPSNVERAGILLLDDDPFMLGLQSRMLQSMGYERIWTAGGAEAALTILHDAASPIDIIVCDLNMPDMDGVEFLQHLNAGPFRCSVILLSGEDARIMHTVQKLLDSGRLTILGALQKPARSTALRALLDCWRPLDASLRTASQEPEIRADELHAATVGNQWVLHFQPKVKLSTGALVGMESLVRWNHPRHGLLFPDSFITAAENCGAIEGLTDWVLRESIDQLMRWNGQALGIGVAVNVSMENLRVPGFASRVGNIVRHAGASPEDVTLEVTESRLMSPSPAPLESLVRLRLKRFGLSIDDFGTGHSSLAQLRDVPFTELKIDRGFVSGARSNQIIRPMLEGSIGIAKRLGMRSVAEGVETEDDWRLLREIGCDLAQGYFIGRPMAMAQLPEWLARWAERRPVLAGS